MTEGERVQDGPWFASILREYKRCGFNTAIDDFGAGYAGMKLLSDFQPDIIKIDMDHIRNVDSNQARQAIVRSLVSLCKDMGIKVIAEGIETPSERDFLRDAGINLMQGYLFARPAFRSQANLDPLTLGSTESQVPADPANTDAKIAKPDARIRSLVRRSARARFSGLG